MKQFFRLMEKGDDYLLSWSFIHCIEFLSKTDSIEYYRQVIMSLSIKPTRMALLLVNRILNSVERGDLNWDKFMRLLKNVGQNPEFDLKLREEAIHYYDYQIRQWEKESSGKND